MYNYIATHLSPHFDDAVGIALLQEYGSKKYPGVEFAEIVMFPNSSSTPDGRPIKQWEEEGYLFVGMAASRFDEHPIAGRARREGECAATLVANNLSIRQNPEVEKLLDYAVRIDTKGGAGQFEISALMQDGMVEGMEDNLTVLAHVLGLLRSRIRRQKRFWGEVKTEFEQYAHVLRCFVPNCGPINVAVIQSDSKEMNAFARSRYGCEAGIVVQQNSRGHVQIHTAKQLDINIKMAVKRIRQAEQRMSGQPVSDWQSLGVDGTLANWHYYKEAQMLLNGSLTATEMPPTKLSLNEIVQIVLNSFKRKEGDAKPNVSVFPTAQRSSSPEPRPTPEDAPALKASIGERMLARGK